MPSESSMKKAEQILKKWYEIGDSDLEQHEILETIIAEAFDDEPSIVKALKEHQENLESLPITEQAKLYAAELFQYIEIICGSMVRETAQPVILKHFEKIYTKLCALDEKTFVNEEDIEKEQREWNSSDPKGFFTEGVKWALNKQLKWPEAMHVKEKIDSYNLGKDTAELMGTHFMLCIQWLKEKVGA